LPRPVKIYLANGSKMSGKDSIAIIRAIDIITAIKTSFILIFSIYLINIVFS
jgi:hypothetical protein